jgi:hypothetical protein
MSNHQEIFSEIKRWMRELVRDWDPEIHNPPIDGMGLPILELIPTKNPYGPTLGDFIATFDEEDQGGFDDIFFEVPEENIPALEATPLTAIWQYPVEHEEMHTDVGPYDESRGKIGNSR